MVTGVLLLLDAASFILIGMSTNVFLLTTLLAIECRFVLFLIRSLRIAVTNLSAILWAKHRDILKVWNGYYTFWDSQESIWNDYLGGEVNKPRLRAFQRVCFQMFEMLVLVCVVYGILFTFGIPAG